MKKYNIILIIILFVSSQLLGQEICDDTDIVQTANITSNDVIAAKQTLVATNEISNSANVTYQAEDYVQLKGGMFVHGNSTLLAKIEECTPVSTRDLTIPGFELDVFNNPTASNVSIEYVLDNQMDLEITLWDILGRKLETLSPMQKELSGMHQHTFDLSNYPSGNFLLHFRTSDGKMFNSKLVKI